MESFKELLFKKKTDGLLDKKFIKIVKLLFEQIKTDDMIFFVANQTNKLLIEI